MAEAFRRENVEADFDWKTHYGAGGSCRELSSNVDGESFGG